MAEVKLTKEQQQVVGTNNCNLLVAAAAGSGKTKVLVERIIKKVRDNGQNIDRLLIVTFTNAAATEMRERIGKALEEALEKEPSNSHLQQQMLLIHNAQITTIHSFCLSVIREFFHVIDLEPSFRIGDEAELSLLKSDVLETVLEQCYEAGEESFFSFVDSYGSVKNNMQIVEYIQKLYDIVMSDLWPIECLDNALKAFHVSEEEWKYHPMSNQIIEEVKNTISDCLCIIDAMVAITEEVEGPALYRDCFIEDRKKVEQLLEKTNNYEEIAVALNDIKFGRLPSKKQENVAEEKKQLAKELRDYVKKQIGKLKEDFFYSSSLELWTETIQMEASVQGLISVTKEFIANYQKEKREKNLLDFNDLEHMAMQILIKKTETGEIVPTDVARTLANRYDEIMIDEYQDSNLIQEAILKSISHEWNGTPNIFMVGDVKQSIYRFRMACPQLFMDKYKTYKEEGAYKKIDLHSNFRSRRTVLHAINVLFAGLMHEDSTEIEYDGAAALNYAPNSSTTVPNYYSEDTENYYTEVLFVNAEEEQKEEGKKEETESIEELSEEQEDGELSQEELSMIQVEALAVAKRIRELIDSGFCVGRVNEERVIEYGDIVILLRTMSGWSEKFLEVLTEQGIPAFADTSSGYFKSFEIRKTLDFLRILDNPNQDIPFASVLHSPIGRFNAQQLAQLQVEYGIVSKEEKKYRYLYDAVREAGKVEPNGRAGKFLTLYDRLKEESAFVSIHELIERFYEYSGFYDIVTVMTGGERRRGNLDMLLAKAKQYEATSFSGLYDFIRYIDKLIKYEVDFGEAASGVSGKMVRIMSIHKSKGLEFPVVFLSGMEKKMNRQDMQSRLIFHSEICSDKEDDSQEIQKGLKFHSELEIGPEFVDTKLRVKSPTLLKKTIAKKMAKELIAEELRILYVGMTRAKEKLILTGAIKHPEKRYATWNRQAKMIGEKGLLFSDIAKARTYYDFICPLLLQKQVSPTGSFVTRTVNLVEKKIIEEQGQNREEIKQFVGNFYLKEVQKQELNKEKTLVEKTKEELFIVLEQLGEQLEKDELEKEIYETLFCQTNYRYPYEEGAKLPVKVTVSELKRLALEEEEVQETLETETAIESLIEQPFEEDVLLESGEDCSYPEFLLPEKKLTGSDRGTAYHRVMELLPLEISITRNSLTTILDTFVQEGKLRQQEREVVSEYKLWKFLNSTLGKKMQVAGKQGKLHREQPFVLGLPAKDIYLDSESTEIVLVQGMIDAFFEEEDELVLLDYKTDYIQFDAKEELTKKYKAQLKYYKKALESLKQKRVKEVWFYSFSKDVAFIVEE